MGLFDKAKEFIMGELIDNIYCPTFGKDIVMKRFERKDSAIKNGAQLTVNEGQTAVFLNEGEIGDIFQPGHYSLTTQNMPITTTLKSWKYGFDSPFKCEILFINTTVFTAQKWGTPGKVWIRDKEFGQVHVGAFGTYSWQVTDPGSFVKKLCANSPVYKTEDCVDELRSVITTNLIAAIGESGQDFLGLASNYKELSRICEERINGEFPDYGITFTKLLVSSINLPEELDKILAERMSVQAMGGIGTYTQKAQADAVKTAAANGGMGGGMEGMMGMMMMQNMMNQQNMMNSQQGYGQAVPPPVPGASLYYLAVNGQQQGPFNMQQLQQLASQGQFTASTHVWKQGMAAWAQASTVAELSQVFGAVPPPPPPSAN
jgi:membrane protease subunit (stomatin/prohibitin family)